MSTVSLLEYAHLAYLSNPAWQRPLYRAIRQSGATDLLEMGVGIGRRSTRMIRVAGRYAHGSRLRYTGIDLFESRPSDHPGLTIKNAHRVLGGLGAKVQLIPGDPFSTLSRNANRLEAIDIVVIGADQDREALARAWIYLPRMLHDTSLVFLEDPSPTGGNPIFRQLRAADVSELAEQVGRAA